MIINTVFILFAFKGLVLSLSLMGGYHYLNFTIIPDMKRVCSCHIPHGIMGRFCQSLFPFRFSSLSVVPFRFLLCYFAQAKIVKYFDTYKFYCLKMIDSPMILGGIKDLYKSE